MSKTPKCEIFDIEIEEHQLGEYDTDVYDDTSVINDTNKETRKKRTEDQYWREEQVKRLLALYLKYADDFVNPVIKKKSVWERIGQILGVTPVNCDRKFRNLKHRYISLLLKKRQFGAYIRWPYFDIFEKINKNNRFKIKFNSKPLVLGANHRFFSSVGGATSTDDDSALFSVEQRPPRRKRRYEDMENITLSLKQRQKVLEGMELKLDRLVSVMEDSNDIQKERNELLQQYLRKMCH